MDPVAVGLVTEGAFTFDTKVDGNRNEGHTGARCASARPSRTPTARISSST
jgi:hypothetical protein